MTSRDFRTDVGLAGAAVLASALITRRAEAREARLLVFLHVSVKQRALQTLLEGTLSGIEVTAVGRIGDFERDLKDGVDAVLAIPTVLSAFNLIPKLRGVRAGSTEERYALVGVGSQPDLKAIASVGALDLLGRDGTKTFVSGILGTSPRIERVSKVEDLLPLLQMQRVDAVLIPVRLISEIKSASKLVLGHRELETLVGLPAVAQVGAGGASVVSAVSKMPPSVSKMLGVDSWR